VNNPSFVGFLERLSDLDGDPASLFNGDGSTGKPCCQRLPRHQLEDQVVRALRLLEPVDRSNPRMVQRREDLRLSVESGEALFVLSEPLGKNLDGYVPPKLGVLCPIDLAHPAFAYELEDLVVSELVTACE